MGRWKTKLHDKKDNSASQLWPFHFYIATFEQHLHILHVHMVGGFLWLLPLITKYHPDRVHSIKSDDNHQQLNNHQPYSNDRSNVTYIFFLLCSVYYYFVRKCFIMMLQLIMILILILFSFCYLALLLSVQSFYKMAHGKLYQCFW